MKLKIIPTTFLTIIFSLLPFQSLSETYSCAYMYGIEPGEPAVVSYTRIGNTFKSLTFKNSSPSDIIFEDENIVVFSKTFSANRKPTIYLTIIDKKRPSFSSGGQRIRGKIDTIKGSCQKVN